MTYEIVRGCQWKDFSTYGMEGKTVAAADLKTGDGQPLPAEVVEHFVRSGNLKPKGGPAGAGS